MIMFIVPTVILGILAAFIIIGYAMSRIDNKYERVVFLWLVLMIDVMALVLTSMFSTPAAVTIVFSFTLTKCLMWCIMNHSNIVNFQLPRV